MKKISAFVLLLLSMLIISSCSNKTGNDTNDAHVHSFSMWSITSEATCTQEGIQSRTCSSCGFTEQSAIAKTSHVEIYDNEVHATCTTDGKTAGSHCKVCGMILVEQSIINASCDFNNGACVKCGKFDESYCFPIYEKLLVEMLSFQNKAKSDGIIEEYLTQLPYGYKNTDTIRQQFVYIKTQIAVFRDGNYRHLMKSIDPTHEDAFVYYSDIQEAYCALLEKQNDSAYSMWNLKKCAETWLFDDTINSLTLACMLGIWENSDGWYINVSEDGNNGIRVGTNLPSNRDSNKTYYYYCKGDIIGYENIADSSATFDAYRIVSISSDSIKLYSFSDGRTYTLSK